MVGLESEGFVREETESGLVHGTAKETVVNGQSRKQNLAGVLVDEGLQMGEVVGL